MTIGAAELLSRAAIPGRVGEVGVELCWRALEATSMGRLGVATGAGVEIYPINYAVDGTWIYFRTAPGSKLTAVTARPQVALEIDAFDDRAAYSILVKGTAERVEAPSVLDEASALSLTAWIPTLKLRWVRIRAHEVTGRVFRREPEPEPYP